MKIRKSPLIAAGIALLAAGWVASGQIGTGATGAERAAAPNPEQAAAPLVTVEPCAHRLLTRRASHWFDQ